MNIKRDGKCPFGTKCSFIHPEDEEEKVQYSYSDAQSYQN